MRKSFVIFFVLVVAAACGILSSCAPRGIYKTQWQPPTGSEEIKAATEFKVRPIDFSAIKPADLGYGNEKEWQADLEPVPDAFAKELLSEYGEQEGKNKKVVMVKKDKPVTSGIVVEVAVMRIDLKWSYFNEQPDELGCNVRFTDAASGRQLFAGTVVVNSRPMATHHIGGSFNRGLWNVGPGLSFSARLQQAARNMTWVLSAIMTEGRIDPAYR